MAVQPKLKELVLLWSRSVVCEVDVGALSTRDPEEATIATYLLDSGGPPVVVVLYYIVDGCFYLVFHPAPAG